tara:strand:+ start:413 stop:655 length:243 start_codon:yes stop_codon:yes gene_type:complete
MSFQNSDSGSGRIFNNADGFAMAFDEAWKRSASSNICNSDNQIERLNTILELIKEHPFYKDHPEKAREVAQFRLRLLNLK